MGPNFYIVLFFASELAVNIQLIEKAGGTVETVQIIHSHETAVYKCEYRAPEVVKMCGVLA